MKVFVDTNVFIASLTSEPERGVAATELLNYDHEFYTSILNLMELRAAMTKKKEVEQQVVEGVIDDLWGNLAVYTPEPSDLVVAFERQRETLLYTMDSILLALAEDLEAELATFDRELLENGATPPEDLV
jgi:predicted nucleic acid-binding protein